METENADPPSKETAAETEKAKKKRKRENQLLSNIRKQMEFYFSAANLGKNRMTAQRLKELGGVPVTDFLTYNKIRAMTTEVDIIVKALKKSEVLIVNEDDNMVKLKNPLEVKQNPADCSIYVEQIPTDADHDWLTGVFSCFGKVDYVSIPKNPKTGKPKGFAFIEFSELETVARVVESFKKAGNYLPCDRDPGELASVRTYDEPDRNTSHIDSENKKKMSKDEKFPESKKRKRKLEETEDSKGENETNCPFKKLSEEQQMNKQDDIHKKLKRALEPDATDEAPHKRPKSESTQSEDSSVIKEVVVSGNQLDEEEDEDATETDATEDCYGKDSGKGKKKIRRKKKSKKSKKEPVQSSGLQILTMNDWKSLRNKYLLAQKEQMSLLKKHLAQTRLKSENALQKNHLMEQENSNITKSTLPPDFVPGILVRISVEEPIVDIKGFKSQVNSTSSHVKYIDVKEGATSVVIRLTSDVAAKEFCESSTFENVMILEGDDEKDYWEVIWQSRAERLTQKSHKERGKQKLLKKAEKVLGQHMRFSEL